MEGLLHSGSGKLGGGKNLIFYLPECPRKGCSVAQIGVCIEQQAKRGKIRGGEEFLKKGGAGLDASRDYNKQKKE